MLELFERDRPRYATHRDLHELPGGVLRLREPLVRPDDPPVERAKSGRFEIQVRP